MESSTIDPRVSSRFASARRTTRQPSAIDISQISTYAKATADQQRCQQPSQEQ